MTYTQANEILQSLPISLYTKTKHNISLVLDVDSSATYVQADNGCFEIHIGYGMLKQYGNNLTERQIRTLFYHEISHILDDTFGRMIADNWYIPTNDVDKAAFNIIADERIETIYKDYFYGVDFDKTKREIIKINPADDSVLNHFLWYVRLRYNADKYDKDVLPYVKRAIKLGDAHTARLTFSEFAKVFDARDVATKEKTELTKEQMELSSEEMFGEEIRADEMFNPLLDEATDEIIKKNAKAFSKNVDEVVNDMNDFASCIEKCLYKNKNKFSSMSAYSGVFNVRAVVNDDYRWWNTANRNGQYKQHNKVHIRFLIDNSGSFSHNSAKTNHLIRCLNFLEKVYPMFSYSFATLNINLEVWSDEDKLNKTFQAIGGNRIPVERIKNYLNSKVQDAEYYNIVMFDGDACTDEHGDNKHRSNLFSVFDRVNTFIIAEQSNIKYTTKFNFAQIIVENDNYVDRITENIKFIIDRFIGA